MLWVLAACTIHLVTAGCYESSPAAPTRSADAGVSDNTATGDTPRVQTVGVSTEILDITFDDVKFDMEKEDPYERSLLTEAIEKMHGRTIRIRGYILPTLVQQGITEFVLVRDNMECCFGPGAALYDCMLVQMEPGKSTIFSIRPVTVEGKFRIDEFPPAAERRGNPLAIYQLEGQSVE